MPSKHPVKPSDPPIRTIDYTINDDGCWVWNWSVETKGYATVLFNGRRCKAHRVAYELANGPIHEGQIIRHLCGNPSCINPDHLKAGTHRENSIDMVNAGNQHHQKLTVDDAKEIRRIFSVENKSRAEIGRQFAVTTSAVRSAIANEHFYDPTYTPPPIRSTKRPRQRIGFELAKEIRQIYWELRMSQSEIARRYQIHSSTVSKIVINHIYPDPDYHPSRRAYNQKLSKAQADEIRSKSMAGTGAHELAEDYGVTPDSVRAILSGKFHHGKARSYRKTYQENGEPRTLLRDISGPAPTSKVAQGRRRESSRNSGRRPRRNSEEPAVLTDNDWELNLDTGCREWRWGSPFRRPFISMGGGREQLAYRIAYEDQYGEIPENGQINHSCNNMRCVNPDHLYLGNQFDNMRDTVRVGNHATQKLSWEDAKAIRLEYEPRKTTYKELGRKFGVSDGAVYRVITNQTFFDPNYIPRRPEVSVRRKLSKENATDIRIKYLTGAFSRGTLAAMFGVSKPCIGKIIRNETYRDPGYLPPSESAVRELSQESGSSDA